MPRFCCLVDERAAGNFRAESGIGKGPFVCNVPLQVIEWTDGEPGRPAPGCSVPDGMGPLHRFDAADWEQADRYLKRMQREGCPTRWDIVGNAGCDTNPHARPWRFRDGLHRAMGLLKAAGAAVPANAEGSVRALPQYKALGSMLGQTNDLYHRSRKEEGVAVLPPHERHGVSVSLQRCEEALATLAVAVAAGIEMIDPAYHALGLEHRRPFRIEVGPPPADADSGADPANETPAETPPKPHRRTPARN